MHHSFRKVLLGLFMLLGMVTIAEAARVTFFVRDSHPNAVELELYSQNRRHVWPGGKEVYSLGDGETKDIPISCRRGEKICYGAWVAGEEGIFWGTGVDNSHRCSDCCYTCNGGATEEINLTE